MNIDMARPAATREKMPSNATTAAGSTKPETGAKAAQGKRGATKHVTAPPSPDKAEKKGKRAAVGTTPAEVVFAQKPKKAKVVRDSFTMPEEDYRKLAELKERCLTGGQRVKKSELLRAGVNWLASLSAKRLLEAVARVESVKTGRPTKV